jgi:hypothetical protein
MSVSFRIFLLAAASLSFISVVKNVRKSRLIISECIFWFLFSFAIVLLAIFPGIAEKLSELLSIMSPVNLVYLIIIGLLMLITFKQTIRISELEIKLKNTIQNISLRDYKDRK